MGARQLIKWEIQNYGYLGTIRKAFGQDHPPVWAFRACRMCASRKADWRLNRKPNPWPDALNQSTWERSEYQFMGFCRRQCFFEHRRRKEKLHQQWVELEQQHQKEKTWLKEAKHRLKQTRKWLRTPTPAV